jgi:hypothetical protein
VSRRKKVHRGFSAYGRNSDVVFLRSVLRLLVTANVVPTSLILVTLMKETVRSFETSVLTRATRRNIQKTAFFIVTAVKTLNLT